jgi:hypothetical protein
LTLEDETGRGPKRCEFAAVSPHSGKTYWVEAKMKAVNGLLGKTAIDGSPDPNPTSHLVPHVTAALSKPGAEHGLIFVDLNAPMDGVPEGTAPPFVEAALRRLERFERSRECKNAHSYVFVTNVAYHRDLEGPPRQVMAPMGLNMLDFNRPVETTLRELYRRRRAHEDAHAIGRSFATYLSLPSTFDGSLPAPTFEGALPPVQIGETYFFEGIEGEGVVGKVTSACVIEPEQSALISITTPDGRGMLISQPMSQAELEDYKEHADAYFGQITRVSKGAKSPLEMFEFVLESYSSTPRSLLSEWMSPRIPAAQLNAMSDDELRLTYAEGVTISILNQTSPTPPATC